MVFSSLLFLFAYLPITLAIYFAVPFRYRNGVLLVQSLVFYAWGEPLTVFVMLFSILSAYVFGLCIARYRDTDPRCARRLMLLSVSVTLSLLVFFKYYNFFAVNLSRLPLLELPVLADLRLPIGISFYTFQILSYTVDLYRRDCEVQRNVVSFGTYVTLFPQLIAGPIVRYREIDRELTHRRESISEFAHGAVRFCVGLSKKVLLGDALAAQHRYFSSVALLEPTALGGWMTAITYTLHLYFDFSGYSDMAIGLGQMFGFHFPENFNYPYISKSITEFWRRWHITLSTWFREYVYIPLGGNRHGKWRQYRNLAVVWLLTGFWHGAGWSFLLWGAYYAVLLIVEKAFLLRLLERMPSLFRRGYTLFVVLVGFLIFSSSAPSDAFQTIGTLFGVGTVSATIPVVSYQLRRILPLLLLSVLGATPLPRTILRRILKKAPRAEALYPILTVLSLLLCVAYLVDSTFSPFAYLQF